MANTTGTLTRSQFVAQCRTLVQLSDKIQDSWELHTEGDDTFLVKETFLSVPSSLLLPSHSAPDTTQPDLVDEDDTAVSVGPDRAVLLKLTYHVVYKESYSVPVLYFNVWDETGQLLELEGVWGLMGCAGHHDKFSYITQRDHPVLGAPWYELHPCRTHCLMQLMGRPDKYLIAWLSLVGREVRLGLGNEYGLL